MTVLIVDDVAFMRSVIKDILVKICSFSEDKISEASGGVDAISKYKKEKSDIVLCDILMPDMNGIDVVKELMAMDPGAKIIMCTSSSEMDTVVDCINMGAKDYILKPPKPDRVIQAIQKVVNMPLPGLSVSKENAEEEIEKNPTLLSELATLRKDVDFLLNEVAELKKQRV